MFDIAFSEILVIAVVALIVIGPERLPKTARTLGHLFGRLQRYVNEVKADISREMELEELRKLKQQVQTAASDLQSSVTAAVTDLQSNVRNVESELNRLATEVDAGGTGTALATDAGPGAAADTTGGRTGTGVGSSASATPAIAEIAPADGAAVAAAQHGQPFVTPDASGELPPPERAFSAPAREAEPETTQRQASLPGFERP